MYKFGDPQFQTETDNLECVQRRATMMVREISGDSGNFRHEAEWSRSLIYLTGRIWRQLKTGEREKKHRQECTEWGGMLPGHAWWREMSKSLTASPDRGFNEVAFLILLLNGVIIRLWGDLIKSVPLTFLPNGTPSFTSRRLYTVPSYSPSSHAHTHTPGWGQLSPFAVSAFHYVHTWHYCKTRLRKLWREHITQCEGIISEISFL